MRLCERPSEAVQHLWDEVVVHEVLRFGVRLSVGGGAACRIRRLDERGRGPLVCSPDSSPLIAAQAHSTGGVASSANADTRASSCSPLPLAPFVSTAAENSRGVTQPVMVTTRDTWAEAAGFSDVYPTYGYTRMPGGSDESVRPLLAGTLLYIPGPSAAGQATSGRLWRVAQMFDPLAFTERRGDMDGEFVIQVQPLLCASISRQCFDDTRVTCTTSLTRPVPSRVAATARDR